LIGDDPVHLRFEYFGVQFRVHLRVGDYSDRKLLRLRRKRQQEADSYQ
jgi:hypothetical protein